MTRDFLELGGADPDAVAYGTAGSTAGNGYGFGPWGDYGGAGATDSGRGDYGHRTFSGFGGDGWGVEAGIAGAPLTQENHEGDGDFDDRAIMAYGGRHSWQR